MRKRNLWIIALIILPMLAGLACRFTAPKPTEPPEVVVETEETTEAVAPPEEEPTATTETQPSTNEEVQDLIRLENSLWVQDESVVFVSFLFQNPNKNIIFEDVEYTIYLYGPDDEEIDRDTSYLYRIFPEQTHGIAQSIYLSDDNVTVSSAAVEWVYDETFIANGFTDPFVIENAQYWENDGFPMVTGKINNEHMQTYTDVRTNIICYNSAGEIVGGGYTFVDFIPGQDYVGFSSYVDVFDTEVSSVEVFPTITYLTTSYDPENIFWSSVSVQSTNFYEDDYGDLLGGVLIQNESDAVLLDSIVTATFFDEADNVTAVWSENIGVFLPGATLGVTPWMSSPPEGTNSVDFELLVLPGEVEESYEFTVNPFIVNSATITGDYNNYVLVNFTNTYSKQASDVDIYVQLYNTQGQIIGGGSTWTTDPIAAGESMEVEIYIDYSDSETVDRIEAWVIPSAFTDFE